MNTKIRIAMAVAAVVVLALIGVNLVPRTGGVGGPSSTPVPTATAAPTPSPSPTPAPSLPPSGQIAPGTYGLDFITFTLPAGWTLGGAGVVIKDLGPAKGTMVLETWQNIATVYSDPCHWHTTATSVGPTVDEVVAAFVAQKRSTKVTPVDVTIDGYSGKQIDLMVPLNIKVTTGTNEVGGSDVITGCDGGVYNSWTSADGGDRYNQGPGQHDLLDILDVNGQTRAIHRVFWQADSAADRAELQAIVDSIKIAP